jgi:hypothetical protein
MDFKEALELLDSKKLRWLAGDLSLGGNDAEKWVIGHLAKTGLLETETSRLLEAAHVVADDFNADMKRLGV